MRIHTYENKDTLTPDNALAYLKEGNLRFVNNIRVNRDLLQLVDQYSTGQFPFAAILGCSDSRVPVELIFDQGLGDLFVVRLAGNIASTNAIGSLEFSCKVLGSKIIVVLGHTECGAVKSACDSVELGNVTSVLKHIEPAIALEKEILANRNSKNKEFVHKVLHHNLDYQIETILRQSDILRELFFQHQVAIVGALYDIKTGMVSFYEDAAEKYREKALMKSVLS